MPETYSIEDFAKQIRAAVPGLEHIPAMPLVAEALKRRPELKQYLQTPAEIQASATVKPEPLPNQAYPMSLSEAAHRYSEAGVPGLLYGSAKAAPSVQSDMMANVLKGGKEFIQNIPSMAGDVASTLWNNFKGVYGLDPEAFVRGAEQSKNLVKGVVHGLVNTPITGAQELGALLAPERVPAPSDEEMRQGARGAGAQATAFGLGKLGQGVKQAAGRYIREAPVRKGYTTLNPETLKPELPVPAIQVETGMKAPKTQPGAIIKYKEPAVDLAARALGGDSNLELGDSLRQMFNEAFPDLKHAQQQNPFLRGAMDSPQKFRATVQWARNRVWRDGIEPAFKAAGPVDLSPVAQQLISEIPESIRVKTPKRALALEKTFTKMFDGKTVDTATLHEFAKEARAAIQSKLAKNAFDRQAAFGTPDGKMAESFNTALRDRLYQHVQQNTGVDIRPIAERYGALSQLEQEALGLPQPKGLLEQIFSGYTFPTKRAIAARIGQRIGEHMVSDPKLLKQAFEAYKLEPAKVTQPFRVRVIAPGGPPSP